jgi:hypothetical protein
MAAIDIGWTPETLRDVSMALQVILARVPEESVRHTAIAGIWDKANEWVQATQKLTPGQADATGSLAQIPPFPLTSQQLLALQASIDRIAQAHAAASPTHVGGTARHMRQSVRRLMSSATALGAILAVGVVIAVVDLALSRDAGGRAFLYVSLGYTAVALAVWGVHFWHLGVHRQALNRVHPLP